MLGEVLVLGKGREGVVLDDASASAPRGGGVGVCDHWGLDGLLAGG